MRSFFTVIACTVWLASSSLAAESNGKHLFICSGQSNMQGLDLKLSFIPTLEAEFGRQRIIVVKDAQGGQPIRRWHKNWVDSDGNKGDKTGDLYNRLMKKVKTAMEGQMIESVTFFWMQGERDAREKHGDVYQSSLDGVIKQLQSDLNRKDIHVVIGRLSDFGETNKGYQHWDKVRAAQVELAESLPSGAWINTDDLNDGKNKQGKEISNDLHMSVEGYKTMGTRFARAGIALIHGKKPDSNGNSTDTKSDKLEEPSH